MASATLAQLRRDAADLLGDLLVLVATDAGTAATFVDRRNLARTENSMDGWLAVVASAAEPTSVGREARVTGPSAARTLTLDPALPAATAVGDVLDVVFHRGTGWRPEDYRRAINRAISSVGDAAHADAVADPAAFDRADPYVALPANAGWVGVWAVEEEGSDGVWREIGPSLWRLLPGSAQVEIDDLARWRVHGRNVRLRGVTTGAELTADTDTTTVDRDYVANMAAAELMMSGSHRQIDREVERTAMFFEQRAKERLTKARRRRRPNLALL